MFILDISNNEIWYEICEFHYLMLNAELESTIITALDDKYLYHNQIGII